MAHICGAGAVVQYLKQMLTREVLFELFASFILFFFFLFGEKGFSAFFLPTIALRLLHHCQCLQFLNFFKRVQLLKP